MRRAFFLYKKKRKNILKCVQISFENEQRRFYLFYVKVNTSFVGVRWKKMTLRTSSLRRTAKFERFRPPRFHFTYVESYFFLHSCFFSLSQHFSFVSLLCASLLRQCIKLLIRYRKQDGLQYGDPLRGTFGTTPTCALVGLRESQILLRPFSRPFTALPVLVGLGEGKPETKTKNEPPEIFALIIWHSLTLEYGNFLSQRAMALLKRKSKIFLIIFFKDF